MIALDQDVLDDDTRDEEIRRLHRDRPRSAFVRVSLWVFLVGLVAAWFVHDFEWGEAFSERRLRNLDSFVTRLRPKPVRDSDWDWGRVTEWAGQRLGKRDDEKNLVDGGAEAAINTLAISVLAIVLAALAAAMLSLPAARNLMARDPFSRQLQRTGWGTRLAVGITRFGLVLLRCLPEYLLAFFFVAIFGLSAWPAVLALAIHNAGILGRLNAETIENVGNEPPRALRAAGAPRISLIPYAIYPAVLPRFLLYFFARWETCVREATVLGLLNLPALGQLISDARVRFRYDQMMFFVLLGVVIVVIGDLVSAWLRRVVRNAT